MITVYVDGSYNKIKNLTGSGIVLIKDGQVFKKSLVVKTPEVHSWNIDGECHAVIEALRICAGLSDVDGVKLVDKEIEIYYDYIGIEKWIIKEWKVKSVISKWYVNQFEQLVLDHDLSVSLIKVKAHSGDQYNDMADVLAKEASEAEIK